MIAIIKYNSGNSTSVKNALSRLGYECIITSNAEEILNADKVIFPGVGEAKSAMEYLISVGLDEVIKNIKNPFLGICLGMQIMCRQTEEGDTKCLGIFDAKVRKFPPKGIVPHMGWNNCMVLKTPLFDKVTENEDFYFVHSYYAELSEYTSAQCDYLLPFSAALQRDNFYGTQFHPEKSGKPGSQLLKSFLEL